jgi:nitrogen fixation protein NifU and related proteins
MFEDVQDLYQEVILDHGRKPRHAKRLEAFDGTAKGDNPMCGDRVQVWVQRDDSGAVSDLGFEARGCAISIASADLMAEVVRGHTAPQLKKLSAEFADMARTGRCEECDAAMERLKPLAGVHEFPSRVKCATLPWHALLAALDGGKEASSE